MTFKTLSFSYPRRGLFGDFATFRLGRAAATNYPPGTTVELICSRTKRPLKRAAVTSVRVGTLTDMAALYAHQAHNWKDYPEAERAALLVASMTRRYPPGRVLTNSIVTVILLKEIYEL